ncbi:MAG: hypothetical protein FWE50_03915 [Alphaproteobacteria bacterium]|nr:hypothetical protein [Alphaproteobacteria bacterium]
MEDIYKQADKYSAEKLERAEVKEQKLFDKKGRFDKVIDVFIWLQSRFHMGR